MSGARIVRNCFCPVYECEVISELIRVYFQSKFDDSIFDTLSDVSSSDEEHESTVHSSIAVMEDNTQLEDIQSDINENVNSVATLVLNQENSFQTEESLSSSTPSRRTLKRRRRKYFFAVVYFFKI